MSSHQTSNHQHTSYLTRVFTEHPLASNLLMIMLVLAGAWGIHHLSVKAGPPQVERTAEVSIVWPGAAAEDVETLVTQPVELQLRGLKNLLYLTSNTVDGSTLISASFEQGTDMGEAVDRVRQRVAQTRDLPVTMEPPVIRRRPQMNTVAAILLSGKGSLEELVPIARQIERELIARGIDEISLQGSPQQEIAIQVDSKTLYQLGVPLHELARKVLDNSTDAPAGSAGDGQLERRLRSLHQQRTARGFEQLPIATESATGKQTLTYLGDIASIERRSRDDQLLMRHNDEPAIMLRLLRMEESDALDEAAILYDWYAEQAELLSLQGIEATIWLEAWRYVRQTLMIVVRNGVSGLLLVVAALFLFLNGRVASWVTLGVPISFLGGLAMFYFFGGTINFVSLVGMVMALGLVVDDAIVVSEHSLTRFEAGASPLEAAAQGSQRMFAPVMASSLTTLAAFLPLLIIKDSPVKEIPLLMICVLIASLVECFMIMPGHLRHSFANTEAGKKSAARRKFDRGFNRFRESVFIPALTLALGNRRAVLALAGSLFVIAISLIASGRVKPQLSLNIGFEFAEAHIQFAAGAPEREKQAFLTELESALTDTDLELGGDLVITQVRQRNWAQLEQKSRTGKQYSSLLVELVPPDRREVSLVDFNAIWQQKIRPNRWVEDLQFSGGDNSYPDLQLYFSGDDTLALQSAADELAAELATYAGVGNVFHDLPPGKEQWVFTLSTQGRAAGLTGADIGRQIRSAFEGFRVQLLTENDTEIEIRVSLPSEERNQLGTLSHLPITTPNGQVVSLASVAHLSSKRGIESITHRQGRKAVNLFATVNRRITTPMAVIADLEREAIPNIIDRYGIRYGLGEQSDLEARVLTDMMLGAVISLALIYLILAWIFASWSWPLAVMVAIPLGLTGAIGGLQLLNLNLTAMAILGMFTLTGVIVNDSIILINDYKEHHSNGLDGHRALLAACRARLRPVILTSLTTMGGLAPMMLESSPMGEHMAPLAVVICFGLLYGTTLILFVVPTLLSVIETLSTKLSAGNSLSIKPVSDKPLSDGRHPSPQGT